MIKKKRANFFVILAATVVAIAIFLIFMSEKAIAPVPNADFIGPSSVAKSSAVFQQVVASQINVSVLMYHHIGPLPENADNIRKGLTVSTEEFESQVKFLKEKNFSFLTLEELNKAINDQKIPEKIAILTFDDGYDDNYSQAFPVLKKYKAKGTFFIITSKIDNNEYMTEDQIKELSSAGNEIGSHSLTHPSLDRLKGLSLEREVKNSKEELGGIIGKPIVSFCYPAGKYNEETIKAVSDAGYKMAVTTHASSGTISSNQLLEISRYRISASMSFPALFR